MHRSKEFSKFSRGEVSFGAFRQDILQGGATFLTKLKRRNSMKGSVEASIRQTEG